MPFPTLTLIFWSIASSVRFVLIYLACKHQRSTLCSDAEIWLLACSVSCLKFCKDSIAPSDLFYWFLIVLIPYAAVY